MLLVQQLQALILYQMRLLVLALLPLRALHQTEIAQVELLQVPLLSEQEALGQGGFRLLISMLQIQHSCLHRGQTLPI